MQRKVAGVIISPVWAAFMAEALKGQPVVSFKSPDDEPGDLKPTLRGVWQGGISYFIDKISKKVATEYTPEGAKQEVVFNGIHSILYWVNKDDPRGDIPKDPKKDSQFENWEFAVRKWADEYFKENPNFKEATSFEIPKEKDDIHTAEKVPSVKIILKDNQNEYAASDNVEVRLEGKFPSRVKKVEFYLNNIFIGEIASEKDVFEFEPGDAPSIQENNELGVVITDEILNTAHDTVQLKITD
jgi:hypothetical protein